MRRRARQRGITAIAAVPLAALALGCTLPRSAHQVYQPLAPFGSPPIVLVYDFAVDPSDVVVDSFGPAFLTARVARSGPESRDRIVANLLAAAMVDRLRARGIKAERAGARTTPPRDAILLKGQFVTVNEDGRSPRMEIGFGADDATLRVQVQAYRPRDDGSLQRIEAREIGGHGPSLDTAPGLAPPATSSVIPGGLTFVLRSQASVDADVERLAELFADRALELYRRQGWIRGAVPKRALATEATREEAAQKPAPAAAAPEPAEEAATKQAPAAPPAAPAPEPRRPRWRR